MTTELIRLIHQDAKEWCDLDEETRHNRFVHWYSHRSNALAAAFASAPGHKLVVTVPKMLQLDSVASRLHVFADIVAVRDERGFIKGEPPHVAVPLDQSESERCRHIELERLFRHINPGPLPLVGMEIPWVMSSSLATLNDGRVANLNLAFSDMCNWSKDVYEWWSESPLIRNGEVVFAPFLPTLEMEAVAIDREFSIYASYDAFPVAVGRDPRIEYKNLRTLISLEIPHLLGVDPQTLSKIRKDYSNEFMRFRDTVLDAVSKVREIAGDEGYERKVRQIQREVIDDPLNALRSEMNSVVKLKSMRQAGAVVGTGITALLACIGAPDSVVIGTAGATLIQLIESIKTQIVQKPEIDKKRTNPMFFLWQVEKQIQK